MRICNLSVIIKPEEKEGVGSVGGGGGLTPYSLLSEDMTAK